MFDTIAGLPLHPLMVHAVVVLLPLMCLATIAVALRPAWNRFALPVVIGNALVLVASFAAKESGEAFGARIEKIQGGPATGTLSTHMTWGGKLPLAAFLLFVVSAVFWYLRQRPSAQRAVGMLAAVVALAAIGMTVYVGDTGARSVWESVVSGSK